MPTWDEILEEADVYQPLALVDKYIKGLHDFTGRTVICYFSAFTLVKPRADSTFFSIVDQDIEGFMTCVNETNKEKLDLIIHSPGGDYEATKRIINYLHETYNHIRVFVPHIALSGGTLIACAADEIYMGPYSSLGPTDPQIFIDGRFIPIGAIIAEFERAFREVKDDPNSAILWKERINRVPIGLINSLEAMSENSFSYLKELLLRRNCSSLSKEKAEYIAHELNTYSKHSSHGRGISLNEAKELGLNVKDLREHKKLEEHVLSIYHAIMVFFQRTQASKLIINHLGRRFIMNIPISPSNS